MWEQLPGQACQGPTGPAVNHSEVKPGEDAGWELGDRDWGQPLAFRHTRVLSPFRVSMTAAANRP